MKHSGRQAISVVGGADGPTSVFIAGRTGDNIHVPLKQKVHLFFYNRKREKVIAKIKAEPHTLEEVEEYVKTRYNAVELPEDDRSYIRQRKNCKAALVQRTRPDLLGEDREPKFPKSESREDIKTWLEEVQAREEKAAAVPEEVFPIDYHLYHIAFLDYGTLDLEIEKVHQIFSVSCSGHSKKMKHLKKVMRDIYRYYGVTEADIADRTERFRMLVVELMEH